jgi:hypothetical protein
VVVLMVVLVLHIVDADSPGAPESVRMDNGHLPLLVGFAPTLGGALCPHASASGSAHTDSLTHSITQLSQLQFDPRTALPCRPQPNIVRYHLDVLPPSPVLPREERFEVVAIPENALRRGQVG